jgi:hypothetical protein
MKAGSHELKAEGVHTDKKIEDMTISELWSYVDCTGNEEATTLLNRRIVELQNQPVIPDYDKNILNR